MNRYAGVDSGGDSSAISFRDGVSRYNHTGVGQQSTPNDPYRPLGEGTNPALSVFWILRAVAFVIHDEQPVPCRNEVINVGVVTCDGVSCGTIGTGRDEFGCRIRSADDEPIVRECSVGIEPGEPRERAVTAECSSRKQVSVVECNCISPEIAGRCEPNGPVEQYLAISIDDE
ncbi:hypothetical protein HFX_6070 (plasmid) [Haloferax mediterranei ATCC 33500]|uniref:Uncharacterized protein n=1 Tax=Haloferax mediterranei (strain ATCC 33500 / DSM 1411 / JCM 8866 / NBRC 14739 / NCIMB 2177 / R-4) TaxID=523841 RepID=I3RAD7_HALMT|nr:hypothetical protein HFX_6070 [Haloferax mediterranei ATCC 33500]